jgi:alkanesulfonate monooxygenase SsuD/methylene tetrahydromethanopterin reductase-like flavin-dependent oxidoreductase (luciferase family)
MTTVTEAQGGDQTVEQDSRPTFGVVLPSQRLPHEATRDLAFDLRHAAAVAAEAGAETIWVWDHMLKAPVYQNSWHDPLIALGAVADIGVRLGTGVLVAPVRPPVQTAMAVATLQSLSGHPMRLGVGTGWNQTEFQAAGVDIKRRGSMTDEFISVVESIFARETDFHGRYWNYDDLNTGNIGVAPEIWIAGGSRASGGGDLGTAEKLITATMAETVAKRIMKQRRWIPRPTAELSDFQADLDSLRRATGDPRAPERVAKCIIVAGHLVETDDPVAAREEQFLAFRQNLVSEKRPPEYLEQRYLVGNIAEIRSRLEQWITAGMEHIGLYLLGDVPQQVTLAQRLFGDLLAVAN